MVKKDSSIKKIADLKGHTFGASPGGLVATLFPALLAAAGLQSSDVKLVSLASDVFLSQFATGGVDSSQAFSFGEPIRVKDKFGIDTNCYSFTTVGLNLLGFTVVTTDATIANKPELVKGFLAGMAKGNTYTAAHTAEAVTIFRNSLTSAQQLALGTNEGEEKILTAFSALAPGKTEATKGLAWGCFQEATWKSEIDSLVKYSGMTAIQTSQAYTNKYLPKACS